MAAVGSRLRGHRRPQAHRQRHQQAEPEAQPCVELEYAEKSHAAVADDAKDVAKMTDFEHIWDLHLLCESQAPKQTPSPKRPHRLQVAHPAKTFL